MPLHEDFLAHIARLNTVLGRISNGEVLARCDKCDGPKNDLGACIKCNGTGWITAITQEPKQATPAEVPVSPEVYQALYDALRARGKGPLGTYGFFDMAIQPYAGMYSNPYPCGEPYEVRIIKSNYRQQQYADALALARCEAVYLDPEAN